MLAAVGKGPKAPATEGGEEGQEGEEGSGEGGEGGGRKGGGKSGGKEALATALKEMVSEVRDAQELVRSLAEQVASAQACPAGGGAAADVRALYKVVARAEAGLCERFAKIEEHVSAGDATKEGTEER